MNDAEINYTKEAFLNPWNLAFLIMAMLSAFFLSGSAGTEPFFNLVLIMAAAAELMYLGIMPRQERFRKVVRAQRAKEHNKPPTQKEIFKLLSGKSQRRYVRLRKLEEEIESNYQKLSYATQGLLDSHIKKIDGLLESYLKLLFQKERYLRSSQSNQQQEVARDIEDLRQSLSGLSPRVKAIKERHLKILEQRLDRFKRSKENLEIIEAQLATIEDVIKYIHEQSLTLRDPEAITFQLDTLLSEVEETEASVGEIEEIFGPARDLLSDIDTYEPENDPLQSSSREGLRN